VSNTIEKIKLSALPPVTACRAIVGELRSWPTTLKVGAVLMTILVIAAIFAPLLAPYDPDLQDFDAIMMPPNFQHLFGTDNIGRDIFSRVLYGARIDLVSGFIMTYVPMAYGMLIGAYAGYRGGWFDSFIAIIINIVIAFPFLVVIIIVVAVAGPGLENIYIAVFLGSWTMYARLTRAEMLVERNKDYVQAAKVLGFPTRRILLFHALPNTVSSAVAFSMSDFVLNILMLAGLSFIGFGAQPPMPEWGAMIAEGKEFILDAWWICAMPGLGIVYAGAALSLIGDGLATRLGVSGGGHK
jgi:peptide/nickel transport system permease protein